MILGSSYVSDVIIDGAILLALSFSEMKNKNKVQQANVLEV